MSYVLEKLPLKKNFMYCMSLKMGSYVAAVVGFFHPAMFVALYFKEGMHDWCTTLGGFMAAFLFIFSIFLFFGLWTKMHMLVEVWVWFSLVFIVTVMIIMVLLATRYVTHGRFWLSMSMFGQILLLLFFYYLILIVHSYAMQLEEPEDDGVYGCDGEDSRAACCK